MKEKISRNKISRHYKSFFELENMALAENDNLMIDWGESLINELVNQEVEKRIAERQLTDEQIERQFTTSHYHYEKGHYYKVRKDRIFGAKWYRDRLVSQKTEGGTK